MATLSMIESPSTTTIIESKPPAYADEPDAPVEKEPLMELTDDDVEVTVISHKPITAKISTTIKHLHRVGGFTARWRGLGQSAVYHFCFNTFGFLVGQLSRSVFGSIGSQVFSQILATVVMCRIHMLWTHAMISKPSSTPWYRQIAPRKHAKALLLPSLVYAVAQQLVFMLPIAVAIIARWQQFFEPGFVDTFRSLSDFDVAILVLRVLAVPAAAIIATLTLLLPSMAALTRVEACLLPEDRETIVPFDRAAILGDIDLSQRRGATKLFVAAWKSFTSAARLRLVKLFVKLVTAQFAIALIGMHVAAAVIFFFAKDQMVALVNTIVL